MQFNQEVARFAKGIVDDVASGRLSADMGLDAFAQEQRHLLNQSRVLVRGTKGAVPEGVKKRSLSMLRQPASRSDPDRLLRAIHQQNLRVARVNNSSTARSPQPVNDLKFFPSEHWPQDRPAPSEPGFYIVPKSIVVEKLEAQLLPSANPNVIARFRSLNPTPDMIKAGSMIVLSDPDNQQCTYEEALLMQTARFVSATLEPLTVEEADFMAQHYGVIQTALAYESKVHGHGSQSSGWHKKCSRRYLGVACSNAGRKRQPELEAVQKTTCAVAEKTGRQSQPVHAAKHWSPGSPEPQDRSRHRSSSPSASLEKGWRRRPKPGVCHAYSGYQPSVTVRQIWWLDRHSSRRWRLGLEGAGCVPAWEYLGV
ncbi:hypothetical protein [Pseudomonas mercuritolerans]|uniref:Uncharacterized protein n=1 Tax=Pseudomonas mercuritolerans TaxID=2951809 RepID=A0ABT2XQK4_9PSED|nr:hypothetical protein [Pseudomonas mercuritolerans]MCV2220987.1 hypothetical protein [Pseudomonas mercuritolerans]